MKQPEILPIRACIAQIERFSAILDVRSPSEFALDHIPGAINTPVLNDQERAHVGTVYKNVGAFEAKRIGAALVARNIAHHLENAFKELPRDWHALIYCWRGGNRSSSMATVLARIGWRVTLLDGGYREFRRTVNTELVELAQQLQWQVICGRTGSAKSALLRALDQRGAQVLDLEALAQHRGSVLGALPARPQPSQKWFETQVWNALKSFDPKRVVFVESESKKVGQNHVPDPLINRMRESACVNVEVPMIERVGHLISEYGDFMRAPESLKSKLDLLVDLHGRDQIQHWHKQIDARQWNNLVAQLLEKHYDPSYDRSIKRNFKQIAQSYRLELQRVDEDALARAANALLKQFDSRPTDSSH